jgi:lipopolysaccharide export system protein LptC
MKRCLIIPLCLLVLAGCSSGDNGVRVSKTKPEAAPVKPIAARTEPVFYNGKTYTLKFAPSSQGSYAMSVSGMTAKQKTDATNVATSAIRYFACPDGKTGKLTEQPLYINSEWRMSARCG